MSRGHIAEAVQALRRGGIVALPTETFYGLAADPRQPAALARVLELKGREGRDKPLLLLVAELDHLVPWVAKLPAGFDRLVAHFWPGPLTLVLPAAEGVAAPLRGPSGGVAVRMTPQPLARRLIGELGSAVTGTSANRSGAAPARTADEVRAAFGGRLEVVVDGGETRGGAPSTLLELGDDGARLLREGAVPAEALERLVRLL